ncbi:hypothetical protein [Streptomyces sp. NPDC007355]|uniref:hypothetical protein n=1 Tax=Streptomyces sp. NPDC007355 TaxID=3364778 RepID=UPI00368AF3FA
MSAGSPGDEEGAAGRVPVLRLETLRDIEALIRELQELHGDLLACEDGERVGDLPARGGGDGRGAAGRCCLPFRRDRS